MESQTYDPFEEIRNQLSKTRRQLLPLWIKIFLWIFLVFGGFVGLGFLASLFGVSYEIEIYGLSTSGPLNPVTLLVSLLYIIKSITAFAFWTEKDWAIQIGFFDAIAGIGICGFMMLGYPLLNLENGFQFNVRLELIALIPYLIKLDRIKDEWKVAKVTV